MFICHKLVLHDCYVRVCFQAATQLYWSLLRRSKLRGNIDIWIGFATLLFRNGKADDARKLYDKSLLSLDHKHRKLAFPDTYICKLCPLVKGRNCLS